MASKRMFSKIIVQSARFLKMSPTARLLYYDLGMSADDSGVAEGFSVMRQTGANEDDLRLLITKGFVKLLNDDLVVVITDWKVNNNIRENRRQPSLYDPILKEMGLLSDKCQTSDRQLSDKCQTSDGQMSAQYSIDKDSLDLGKVSIDKDSKEENPVVDVGYYEIKNPVEDIINCNRITMSNRAWEELRCFLEDGIDADMIRLAVSEMLDHGARNWAYLRGILNNWIIAGYKSVSDVLKKPKKESTENDSWYKVDYK